MTINPTSSALLSHFLESCSDNLKTGKRQKSMGFQQKTQKAMKQDQDAEKLQRRGLRRLQESSFKV
jgi:hypothetical protein